MQSNRNLSEKEIRILQKSLKEVAANRFRAKKVFLIWSIVALVIATFCYFKLDSADLLLLLAVVVAIYVIIGMWSFLQISSKLNHLRKSIESALKRNMVKSIKVSSREYIELSEVNDEGVHYLFQLPNSKILSFGGQDFYPTKTFPSDEFEIAICYDESDKIVLIEKNNFGSKIKPTLKITGKNKLKLIGSASYPNPEKFQIVDGILEDFSNNGT